MTMKPFHLALSAGLLLFASCASTTVRTFASPADATAAIVAEVDAGNRDEASRIFDSFARASIQRERVYAELFGTAEQRYGGARYGQAADVLEFLCAKYPGAVNAREGLVYARFLERADLGEARPEQTRAMGAAIEDYRSVASSPSAWVELASVQFAIDEGDLAGARRQFGDFLGSWDGNPPDLMAYVEDLGRYLETH
ncbi:MAG: hypothetical protein AAFU73_12360 [Planctomycetota bacterium]